MPGTLRNTPGLEARHERGCNELDLAVLADFWADLTWLHTEWGVLHHMSVRHNSASHETLTQNLRVGVMCLRKEIRNVAHLGISVSPKLVWLMK